jgi:hypothetical protein
MTAAVLDRPGLAPDEAAMGDARTLEDLLTTLLDEARGNGSAECPVCQATMSFTRAGASAAGEARAAAECGGCGSRLE